MNSERFQLIQEVFHRALENASADREALISEAFPDDPDAEQEVLALLDTVREGDMFLETSLLDAGTLLVRGQRVGPYRIEDEIGRGGMGIVYLAEDIRLSRRVALKALTPELIPDQRQRERFRREAVAAGSLSHPVVATVYALEEVDGRFYIVSEYVPGRSLRSEMGPEPVGPQRVLEIGLQLAGGLAAAHEKGIVHRDLKPENVVRVDDERLKIVDFGLAIGPGLDFPDQRLTRTGVLVGTPAYMSPEQLRGDPVDLRSDIFSLGVLLYELLVGEHPFADDTLMETSARILRSRPSGEERLRARAPALALVVLRCLEKAPQDRFDSMREVAARLREVRRESGTDLASSEAIPQARSSAAADDRPALSRHWWTIHQIGVILTYTVMIILLFVARARHPSAPFLFSCAFLLMACGIWNGALRVHLLFTARFNTAALGEELTRRSSLMWPVDLIFSLVLLGASAALIRESQPWAAALASVGVSYAAAFLVVEPTTVRSAFPTRG